jgi:hypothetical protein
VADLLAQVYGAKETAANYRGRGDTAEVISKHYAGENLVIAADTVSNSLLISAAAEQLAEIESLVQRLEEPPESDARAKPNPEDFIRALRGEGGPQRGAGRNVTRAAASVGRLSADYERLEQEAAQAAADYRRSVNARTDDSVTRQQQEKAKAALRDRVAAAFAARQALQRAGLEQLRQRFTRIERQIDSREQIRAEIIDRRVEELLNPNLQWAPPSDAGPRAAPLGPGAFAEETARPGEMRIVGGLDYDESRLAHIHSRVSGRVERLYVDYTGVEVKKGDAILEFHSPELHAAQQEFLTARRSNREQDGRILIAAREKLRLFGMTEEQIDQLEKSGEPTGRLTASAPLNGIVTEKLVREGERIDQGTHLLTIADLTQLWAKFDLPMSEMRRLRVGQPIAFAAEGLPGQTFQGKVVFISPEVNPNTRTVTVIAEAPNERRVLKPGMSVQTVLQANAQTQERLNLAQRRLELLFEQYRAGQAARVDEIVAAQTDLLEARLSAAQNAQERSAALRDHLAAVKDLLRTAQAQYQAGQATPADVLAVQAEILKIEQQIDRAADAGEDESATTAPKTTDAPSASLASPPASTTGGNLAVLETKLAAAERRYQSLREAADAIPTAKLQEAFEARELARAEVAQARRDHETTLQLLRLDLQAATLRVEAAKALLAEAENVRARAPAAVSEAVLLERRVTVQQAEVEVRRAETLLESHRQQGDPQRPQLERPDLAAHIKEADLEKLVWSVLGLKLEPVDRQAVETGPFRGGLAVLEILTDGPADKAGLRAGDILVGLHVWETISNDNLAFVLQQHVLRVGDAASSELKAFVLRRGEVFTATLSPDRRGAAGPDALRERPR